METLITYGSNHNRSLVLQLNYNAIKSISIFNWDANDIDSINEPYIVAVWKVKSLNPKPAEKTYTLDTSFSLN
jgi:hypothetical protein